MQFGRGKPSAGAFYDSDFTTIDQVLAVGLLNGLQGKNDLRVFRSLAVLRKTDRQGA